MYRWPAVSVSETSGIAYGSGSGRAPGVAARILVSTGAARRRGHRAAGDQDEEPGDQDHGDDPTQRPAAGGRCPVTLTPNRAGSGEVPEDGPSTAGPAGGSRTPAARSATTARSPLRSSGVPASSASSRVLTSAEPTITASAYAAISRACAPLETPRPDPDQGVRGRRPGSARTSSGAADGGLGPGPGHPHHRGGVDPAAAGRDRRGQPLVGGGRRDQEDPVQPVGVGDGEPLLRLVGGQVGGDRARRRPPRPGRGRTGRRRSARSGSSRSSPPRGCRWRRPPRRRRSASRVRTPRCRARVPARWTVTPSIIGSL